MGRSASSWTFMPGNHGPIRVNYVNQSRFMYVNLSGKVIIGVDLLLGKCRLVSHADQIGKQAANAYRRFFENCSAARYEVELRGESLYLVDKIKRTRQVIPMVPRDATGEIDYALEILLPTRSVIKILGARTYVYGWDRFVGWNQQFDRQREQRGQAAT